MNTPNYTQFSKKQLLFGLDKNYAVAYFIGFITIGTFTIFINLMNILPFKIEPLYTIVLATLTYLASVVLFKKDPYWFRKQLIHWAIKNKYKSLNDISPR